MRLLIDTNIFLEVLLEQDRAQETRRMLSKTDRHEFFISDFSLHSIGLLLFRRHQQEVFRIFMSDMFRKAGVVTLALSPGELEAVIQAAQQFNLDFDDAYQYVVAEKRGLQVVSFDSDFGRTERGRRTPDQVDP
ncbi:MAG: PIN domain-containing protein [Chloroflexota bacterium]|nr:PIN domain-containing protein [Chloroflexota bacterium]